MCELRKFQPIILVQELNIILAWKNISNESLWRKRYLKITNKSNKVNNRLQSLTLNRDHVRIWMKNAFFQV